MDSLLRRGAIYPAQIGIVAIYRFPIVATARNKREIFLLSRGPIIPDSLIKLQRENILSSISLLSFGDARCIYRTVTYNAISVPSRYWIEVKILSGITASRAIDCKRTPSSEIKHRPRRVVAPDARCRHG